MNLEIQSFTDVGKRNDNQDYLQIKQIADNYLFVVCDGLGAHTHSERAAKYFADSVSDLFDSYLPILNEDPIRGMHSIIVASAHAMSKQLEREHNTDAFTTCAVAYLSNQISVFAHLGDTRIYRLEHGNIKWRTIDHTLAQQWISQGKLSEDQLNSHPARNQLTQCLGVNSLIAPDISVQDPLKKNEALLLCSDGFWEHLSEEELKTFTFSEDLSSSLENYLKKIKDNVPALDNVTAIFVRPTS